MKLQFVHATGDPSFLRCNPYALLTNFKALSLCSLKGHGQIKAFIESFRFYACQTSRTGF